MVNLVFEFYNSADAMIDEETVALPLSAAVAAIAHSIPNIGTTITDLAYIKANVRSGNGVWAVTELDVSILR